MKKIFLYTIATLILLSFTKYSYAQDFQVAKDCLEQRHNAEYQCDKVHKACVNACSGQYIDKCIGACFDEKYTCYDAVKAEYDKCLKGQPSESPTDQKASSQQTQLDTKVGQGKQPAKGESEPSWPPIFINEWLRTISDLMNLKLGIIEIGQEMDKALAGDRKPLEFTPAWFEMIRQRSGELYQKTLEETQLSNPSNYYLRLPITLPGDQTKPSLRVKVPGNDQFIELIEDYEAPKGTVIETNKPVWFQTRKAIFYLEPPTGGKAVLELGDVPVLKAGKLDVIYEKKDVQKALKVQTPNTEIYVIGTQFSIVFDQDKKESLVAVYQGVVEVKTKSGETAKLTPDGNLPGMIAIKSKTIPLLPIILIIIVVAISFWFVKRKKKRK